MNTTPTAQELLAHPLMAKVQADIAETRRAQEQQRMADQMDAARIRTDQGRYLADQYTAALAKYEEQRLQLHDTVGQVWAAAQAYSAVTRQLPSGFPENTFNEINLPTLKPTSAWPSSFTTTRAAVMAWFSSQGKSWS